MPTKKTPKVVAPDERPLAALQASRLSRLSGVAVEEIEGRSIAELAKSLRWQIDPWWFLFERICGKVVKTDPITGVDYPVPFATVDVFDTDCDFFAYFPLEWKYTWFFPFWCESELIGTTTTDACGHFCVWVPRFEIEWIRRWRLERICLPEILQRPTIGDVVGPLLNPPWPTGPIGPGDPGPDPVPDFTADGGLALRRVEGVLGQAATSALVRGSTQRTIGDRASSQLSRTLARPAYPESLPPPLPTQLRERFEAVGHQALRELSSLDVDGIEHAEGFHPAKWYGPYWRCFDVIVPEWVPIISAPDITFEVTQDVDGDGTPEVIYSEGFSDIRWNATNIPDVTLHASPIAVATNNCNVPPTTCDEQGIEFVGLMPLELPDHDPSTGFALRPNAPRNPGTSFSDPHVYPSNAPYTGTLQLYGCADYPGASFYRVLYSFDGGATVPFFGRSWPIYPFPAGSPTTWVNPDAAGWYPIITDPEDWWPPHLLLEWPTGATGTYELSVEFSDASKTSLFTTPTKAITVDNAPFAPPFVQLRWKEGSGGAWTDITNVICPEIHRAVPSDDLYFEITYLGSTTFLRSVELSGGGCSDSLVEDSGTFEHWYVNSGDNSFTGVGTFRLPGGSPPGAYSFMVTVISRAFNPAGSDGGHVVDWYYDPVYRYIDPSFPVAVVDS
jgi:hypothetical protein